MGRRLGMRLDVPFIDTDHVIEHRIGCSIRDYFDREGEAAFRDLEQTVIADLAANAQGVLATGGGAVLREANRTQLRDHFHVIYLRSSPEDLFRRLRHDVKRPLLQVATPWAGCVNCTTHATRSTGKPPMTWSTPAVRPSPCS